MAMNKFMMMKKPTTTAGTKKAIATPIHLNQMQHHHLNNWLQQLDHPT